MKSILQTVVFLALIAPAPLSAASYVQQASFAVQTGGIAAMDSDSLGNLYLLGLPAGATTWQVTGYRTPELSPLFSFDTGISSPMAFAVEGTGVVDVLDNSAGLLLKRFTNTGAFLSQSTYPAAGYDYYSAAFDKSNGLLYVGYQYTYHPFYPMCLGCQGPPTVTKAVINQYDLQGRLLRATYMPGASSTPSTTCYRPSKLAADGNGGLYVADAWCQQLLKFAADGTIAAQTTPDGWSYAYFDPQSMWTDPQANLYVSAPLCGSTGCHSGIMKLDGSANVAAQILTNATVGSAPDGRIIYLAPGGTPPLLRYILDAAPSVPAQSAPVGWLVQHSSEVPLAWQAASDSDGDQISYSVYLGTSPGQLALAGTTEDPALTTPLAFGSTYYWQVVAQDYYQGLPVQRTQTPVAVFTLGFRNGAPQPSA